MSELGLCDPGMCDETGPCEAHLDQWLDQAHLYSLACGTEHGLASQVPVMLVLCKQRAS